MLNFKLIVAIPLLRNKGLLEAIKTLPENSWGEESISYLEEVKVPDVYENICAFVFPYAQEEVQFVPTSIIEAMHFGVPVVMPRLNFLKQFHEEENMGLVFEDGDVSSLVEQVDRLRTEPEYINTLEIKARSFIDAEYDISNTVKDIETIFAEF